MRLLTYLFLSFPMFAMGQSIPLNDPIEQTISIANLDIEFDLVVDDLNTPIAAQALPGSANAMLLIELGGEIKYIDLNSGEHSTVVSLADRILTGSERGLLGLALHPDFSNNGLLYTYTSEPAAELADFSLPSGVNVNHDSVVAEWQATNVNNSNISIVVNSRRELLRIAQPQSNHNAGTIVFDELDYLYIALGDGGGSNDNGSGHSAQGNGQDAGNALGSILRIDPQGNTSANGQYAIPTSNPFINDPQKLDEIYAYGLRNPYKISYDLATMRLFAADVGQNNIEEVNIVDVGDNLGWPLREGSFRLDRQSGNVINQERPDGLVDPWVQYDHDEGFSITGGQVYRGSDVPDLQYSYVFGDFNGRLFFVDENQQIQAIDADLGNVYGFAEDNDSELYLFTGGTRMYKFSAPEPAEPTPSPAPAQPEPSSGGGGGAITGFFCLLLGLTALWRVRCELLFFYYFNQPFITRL